MFADVYKNETYIDLKLNKQMSFASVGNLALEAKKFEIQEMLSRMKLKI